MKKNNWENKKEDIQKYIEQNQPEIYWDQRDELSAEQIETIVTDPDGLQSVEDEIWENNIDYISEMEDSLIKEVISEFDLEGDQDDDKFREFCQGIICVDGNIEGLLRNTGDQVFFHDTEIETSGYGQTPAGYRAELGKIKRVLKITGTIHDDKIMQMISQASYGGQLVVYFMAGIDEISNPNKMPSIKFKNMNIAIIDTANGSGDSCFIQGCELVVPFDREKIFFDKSIKYNYSFEVCGMVYDWCSSTQWGFTDEKAGKKSAKKSTIQIIKETNAKYDEVFKSGKCSFGDMNIKRHRNVTYINDFPCGNKCKDCGTFWID